MENEVFQQQLSKATNGDINAFHIIFDEFKKPLKSFLYRLLIDRNLVDDFYHDSFIRAFDKIKGYNEQSSFKTWCFSIASNLCIDHLRKKTRWSTKNPENSRVFAIATPSVAEAFIKC